MDDKTLAWWAGLTAATFLHAVFSLRFARRERGAVPGWAIFCYSAFAVGAFLRSAFPVRWSTRPHACLWDLPPYRFVGSDLFDRIVAQTAEVSLGTLFALALGTHIHTLSLPRTAFVAKLCAWPIVLAQCSCWVGEISDNKLWHVYEESLWGGTFAVHIMLALTALATGSKGAVVPAAPVTTTPQPTRRSPRLAKTDPKLVPLTPAAVAAPGARTAAAAGISRARFFVLVLAVLSVPYVYFMFKVDVPMYYGQWQADEAKHVVYDDWTVGLKRMLTCQDVADDWVGWSEDVLWMSLYFGVGPFAAHAVSSSLRALPATSA